MCRTNKGNKKNTSSKPVKYVTVAALPFKGIDKARIVFFNTEQKSAYRLIFN